LRVESGKSVKSEDWHVFVLTVAVGDFFLERSGDRFE
jgi:hypothetical protein